MIDVVKNQDAEWLWNVIVLIYRDIIRIKMWVKINAKN